MPPHRKNYFDSVIADRERRGIFFIVLKSDSINYHLLIVFLLNTIHRLRDFLTEISFMTKEIPWTFLLRKSGSTVFHGFVLQLYFVNIFNITRE